MDSRVVSFLWVGFVMRAACSELTKLNLNSKNETLNARDI